MNVSEKKIMKKALTAALALLTVTSVLVSCGGTEPSGTTAGSDDVNASADTQEAVTTNPREAIREDVPADLDFAGYEFKIQTRDADHHTKELIAEAENGETINDAVYRRNSAVEERLNVKISAVLESESPETIPIEAVRKAVMAGAGDYCDLALLHTIYGANLAAEGLFANWYDLKFVDFSKPWWNKSVADELTIGDKLYLAIGDMCLSAIDYAWSMVYNKEIAANNDLPDIYAMVDEGKWTLEQFRSMITDAAADLNGDGAFDDQDMYGFVTHDNSAICNWMFALDQKVTKKNADNLPELALNTDRMASIVEKVYDLLYNGHQTYVVTDTYTSSKSISHDLAVANMFSQGQTLFAALRIYVIDELRSMEANFGIIPFPKYDEAQAGYYTHVDGHAPLICIPKTNTEYERTGAVLECLCAESYRTCIPAVYDIVLSEKYSRDEMSVHMLDLILEGRTQNFGYVYEGSTGMQFSLTNLMKQKKSDFASYYKSHEKGAIKSYTKIIEQHQSIDD